MSYEDEEKQNRIIGLSVLSRNKVEYDSVQLRVVMVTKSSEKYVLD